MSNNFKIRITPTSQSRIHEVDFVNIPFGRVLSDHMFVMDYNGREWIDPRIVPFSNFEISPANLALHYGQSIFEGMKASKFGGKAYLFRPEMHLRRFTLSAERMCMPAVNEQLLLKGIQMLCELDIDWIPDTPGYSLYIRPFMFANDEYFGVHASEKYRLIVFTGPVGPYYPKPIKLWVEEVFTRAAQGGAGEAKCAGNYGAALLPTRRAQMAGYDQVMWMDAIEKKYVQEVGTMNLFFVIDGKVITPATTGTILRGVTRDSFILLLKEWGYTVEDRLLSIAEIADAYWRGQLQECFGAGTAAVVSHISEITWRDRRMELSEINEQNRPIGTRLKKHIDQLRAGLVADEHHWLKSCENSGVKELLEMAAAK